MITAMSKRLRIAEREFPNLHSAGYEKRSRRDKHYNCIAYAAGDLRRWWDHVSGYWPDGATEGDETECLVEAFAAVGFEKCISSPLKNSLDRHGMLSAIS